MDDSKPHTTNDTPSPSPIIDIEELIGRSFNMDK
jgi:hypothetical protein